ncbi:MAG: hypothetical protein KME03_15010 [Aphanocapsa lilacina HA4352-LM1]|jgi:hypothetical protein|nr:hypothetical protein [Aphanocapsa lilacina HA4352-LM1]
MGNAPSPSEGEGLPSKFDLSQLPANWTAEIKAETPEDRAARIKREDRKSLFQLIRDTALLFTALGVTVAAFAISASLVTNPQTAPDDKKWASALLSLIAGGVLGYWTGKSAKDGKD